MKVWLLFTEYRDHSEFVGAFSTREIAEQVKRERADDDDVIDEVELDEKASWRRREYYNVAGVVENDEFKLYDWMPRLDLTWDGLPVRYANIYQSSPFCFPVFSGRSHISAEDAMGLVREAYAKWKEGN